MTLVVSWQEETNNTRINTSHNVAAPEQRIHNSYYARVSNRALSSQTCRRILRFDQARWLVRMTKATLQSSTRTVGKEVQS